ncbi:hypothetical protein G0Q06_13350 [Puniceicoccales bacterium CK1056]|uniref:Circularly permuted type 2 ATP-grasp protein n=1 Tax=Oceanipulchritudo coccoides TaxID=2706888 RepID=A0A6B2M6L1_9BACT|nr:hypothetical protein [Oceanipulchritudo coccoides]
MTYEALKKAFGAQSLFEDKTWRISPEAWPLDKKQIKEIHQIGQACLEFYRASELLYTRSHENKNLLRNAELKAPWVADYLDRGKPDWLVRHARSKTMRRSQPMVIRPDLLATEEGFALTEVDSVPGGIGLTAFLNDLYAPEPGIVGAEERIVHAFYSSMASLRPDKEYPVVAIVVSDEASTYRPEMEWLARRLQTHGKRVYCLHPGDVFPVGDTLCADIDGNPEEIDVLYRFWELFDLDNIPISRHILQMLEDGAPLAVTPPMRHFQEEKLNLVLFHHPRLEHFWRENLSKPSFKLLNRIIPKGWIMDPVDLPPNAVLDAPHIGGNPIYKWEQLADASQKERNLIMKLSGFHENAWGARSVLYGSDASREEWLDGIKEALEGAGDNLYLLQEYKKPARLKHPVFSPEGELFQMNGRLRLCPYYFVEGEQVETGGVLATFCPADKKIIHGMRDAALLPVKLS